MIFLIPINLSNKKVIFLINHLKTIGMPKQCHSSSFLICFTKVFRRQVHSPGRWRNAAGHRNFIVQKRIFRRLRPLLGSGQHHTMQNRDPVCNQLHPQTFVGSQTRGRSPICASNAQPDLRPPSVSTFVLLWILLNVFTESLVVEKYLSHP